MSANSNSSLVVHSVVGTIIGAIIIFCALLMSFWYVVAAKIPDRAADIFWGVAFIIAYSAVPFTILNLVLLTRRNFVRKALIVVNAIITFLALGQLVGILFYTWPRFYVLPKAVSNFWMYWAYAAFAGYEFLYLRGRIKDFFMTLCKRRYYASHDINTIRNRQ